MVRVRLVEAGRARARSPGARASRSCDSARRACRRRDPCSRRRRSGSSGTSDRRRARAAPAPRSDSVRLRMSRKKPAPELAAVDDADRPALLDDVEPSRLAPRRGHLDRLDEPARDSDAPEALSAPSAEPEAVARATIETNPTRTATSRIARHGSRVCKPSVRPCASRTGYFGAGAPRSARRRSIAAGLRHHREHLVSRA